MSILYMNPGFPQLFDEKAEFFQDDRQEYTHSGAYFIPLDYKDFHTICSCNGHTDIYFRFDLYFNLTNESWKGRKGFLRVSTANKEVTLSIDDHVNLIVSSSDVTMYRKKAIMNRVVPYELHIKSTPEEECIELFIDNELAYTNNGKAYLYLNHEAPINIACKNIVYVPDMKMMRHGVSFSSLILSDMRLGDVTCCVMDCVIDTDWAYNNIYEQNSKMNLSVDIPDNIDVYALSVAGVPATGNGTVAFVADGEPAGIDSVDDKDGVASDIMEVSPSTKTFWTGAHDFEMEVS